MTGKEDFIAILKKHQHTFHPVIEFNPLKEKILPLDFTQNNQHLTADIIEDTQNFSEFINHQLQTANCRLGIGGYAEHRSVYSRSSLFNSSPKASPAEVEGRPDDLPARGVVGAEPRRLHLGTDIWGPEGTHVHAPLGGMVYSFAFSNHFGDYGVTIILLHQVNGFHFYTLYGHLSLNDIQNLKEGSFINRGNVFGHFGKPDENGHWPPHLHFQIIIEMGIKEGDYPGTMMFVNTSQVSYLQKSKS